MEKTLTAWSMPVHSTSEDLEEPAFKRTKRSLASRSACSHDSLLPSPAYRAAALGSVFRTLHSNLGRLEREETPQKMQEG
jgi:hypothetical protein